MLSSSSFCCPPREINWKFSHHKLSHSSSSSTVLLLLCPFCYHQISFLSTRSLFYIYSCILLFVRVQLTRFKLFFSQNIHALFLTFFLLGRVQLWGVMQFYNFMATHSMLLSTLTLLFFNSSFLASIVSCRCKWAFLMLRLIKKSSQKKSFFSVIVSMLVYCAILYLNYTIVVVVLLTFARRKSFQFCCALLLT